MSSQKFDTILLPAMKWKNVPISIVQISGPVYNGIKLHAEMVRGTT